jgi:hypothetical protein
MLSGAKDAPGREKALREFISGWLKDHGLGGSRFKSFDFSHYGPTRSSDETDFDYTGECQLSQPEERKVYFRVRTVGFRIWSFELSEHKLHISALLRQEK